MLPDTELPSLAGAALFVVVVALVLGPALAAEWQRIVGSWRRLRSKWR